MTDDTSGGLARRPRHGLFIAGVFLLAFNMRPALTSLPPIFSELETALHLSSVSIVILATIPIVCFGLFSLITAPLSRRFGEEALLGCALVLLALGLLLRGLFPSDLIFLTVPAAGGIAFINVLLPSLLKRRDPAHAGWLLGLYLLALYAGSTIGSAIAAPLFRASGGSLFIALGLWSIPAGLAILLWIPQMHHRTMLMPARVVAARPDLRRNLLAWQVTAFMGLQSLTFYSTVSWLPALFRHRGASLESAGFLVSMLSIGGIATALLIPVVAHRRDRQTSLVVPSVLACVVGTAGCVLAPLGSAVVWTGLLGLGQGAGLGLAIYFAIARTKTPGDAASLSAMAQFVGYLLASVGTLGVGLIHVATGSWDAAFALVLALTVAELVVGVPASRARVILPDPNSV